LHVVLLAPLIQGLFGDAIFVLPLHSAEAAQPVANASDLQTSPFPK
jgi:hypothetical protein